MKNLRYSLGFASDLITEKISGFMLNGEIDKDDLRIYFT